MKTYLAQRVVDDFYGIDETIYVGESLEAAKKACVLNGTYGYYVKIEEWEDGINVGIGILNLSDIKTVDVFEKVMNLPIGSLK